jgi:HEAT repeat protein
MVMVVHAAEINAPTEEEISSLLPGGMDPPSAEDLKNIEKIKSYGEPAIPVLASLLIGKTDIVKIGMLVAIAEEIKGDHSEIVKQLHVLREKEGTKVIALQCLQRLGRAEDARIILPMLSDKDEAVRVNAALMIQRFGDAETLNQARDILDKRSALLTQEQREKDWSIGKGYAAISNGLQRIRRETGTNQSQPQNDASENGE